MSRALIDSYLGSLYARLPSGIAEEAADGLQETFDHHLEAGGADETAARAALAEFGDLDVVVGEYVRQSPGRRAALLLLATGPIAGGCWAAALIASRAWTWPVPVAARVSFGAGLLLAALALGLAAVSRHSYRRTRLGAAASPVILVLDGAAVAAVLTTAPAVTWTLALAMAVSLSRIALIGWTLPRLALRHGHGHGRRRVN